MVNTFCRLWPAEVDLWLYAEGFVPNAPIETQRPPVVLCDLMANAPWLSEFKKSYCHNPRYTGGVDRRDYRRDACRFVHKVAALGAAIEDADCDVLLWIDADVVTHASVTEEWLNSLFPQSAHLAWLDRLTSYPELGFFMMRLPECRKLIRKVVEMYRGGSVFQLPEQHDSFVIQHVATIMASQGKIKIHSLSGAGRIHTGHPWANSRLAECLDHLKGESRKAKGHSLATDIKVPRLEPYWQGIMKGAR